VIFVEIDPFLAFEEIKTASCSFLRGHYYYFLLEHLDAKE